MKKTLFFAALFAMTLGMAACGDKENTTDNQADANSGATDSTLKAGTIGNGSITIAGSTADNVFGADFNNDGILEFRISGEGEYVYLAYDYAGGNNIVNVADQWDYIDPLGTEVVIDANSRFEGQGDAMFENVSALPSLFFVGCRFYLADGVHYGWIKAHQVDGNIEWGECVYRTTPGASITTGKN
ncbi:MAG: hypothetical protein J6W95_06350 [Bacteroidales bacterium]|nr:hypothetical protein [Bacteroidales bacterium]